jgi:hypothetical protein
MVETVVAVNPIRMVAVVVMVVTAVMVAMGVKAPMVVIYMSSIRDRSVMVSSMVNPNSVWVARVARLAQVAPAGSVAVVAVMVPEPHRETRGLPVYQVIRVNRVVRAKPSCNQIQVDLEVSKLRCLKTILKVSPQYWLS